MLHDLSFKAVYEDGFKCNRTVITEARVMTYLGLGWWRWLWRTRGQQPDSKVEVVHGDICAFLFTFSPVRFVIWTWRLTFMQDLFRPSRDSVFKCSLGLGGVFCVGVLLCALIKQVKKSFSLSILEMQCGFVATSQEEIVCLATYSQLSAVSDFGRISSWPLWYPGTAI